MRHGDESFPIGVHKAKDPPNPAVGDGVRYQIIYPHWHREFELLFMSRGDGVVSVDGVEHDVHEGEAAFIPSNATHWSYRLVSSRETEYYAVVFSPRMLSNGAHDVIDEKYVSPVANGRMIFSPVLRRDVGWQAEALDTLRELVGIYDSAPYDNDPAFERHPELFPKKDVGCPELRIKTALLSIWQKCALHATDSPGLTRAGRVNYERVQRAIKFMHEHFNERIELGDIAGSIYVSREYFSHIFNEFTHTSPIAYLNGYRIRRSMELLDGTDMKISDIATSCGFEQISYFNRKFAELVRCTPTEYRRGVRKNADM